MASTLKPTRFDNTTYQRKWRHQNADKARLYRRRWYHRHKQQALTALKKYKAEHPEYVKRHRKRWIRAHPASIKRKLFNQRARLSNTYVRYLLSKGTKIPRSYWPKTLVDAHRACLIIKRRLWKRSCLPVL